MNSAYRLIWNDRLGAWCVAPEIASARGKRSGGVKRSTATLLLTLALGSHVSDAADLSATALPSGGQVTAGQAAISGSGAAMTINQGSQRTIINWQSFDIGSQASVNFQQPNASAVALNRVSGPTVSRIEGQLSANGQVFLVNPNGVLFGNGARVNVGGLVASTLNIRDADFLSGNYTFSGTGGSITNQGQITAAPGGYLAFIAPTITNNGNINASQGTVAMGAGERVRLNFAGDRLVGLDVSASTIDTLITNRQAIRAEGGAIVLTAAGAETVTRSVINNTGVLEASSLTSDGGRIVLTAGNDINLGAGSLVAVDGKKGGEIIVQARSGTLLAEGGISARGLEGSGGSIRLLGNQVGLITAAQVDASGATGGGFVLVGGDYQGGNAEAANARATYVAPDVTIKANALRQGDGGKVIVWADEIARFYGNISADGAGTGGNGGFVETSGKAVLDASGSVSALGAGGGRAGSWLLDPYDITIQTTGPNSNVTASPNFTSSGNSAIVTTGSIQTALNAGTSVTVTTGAGGAQAGNITVANAIAKSAGGNASLTLNATNNIVFNAGANVTSTVGALGLTLNAGGAISTLRGVSLNGGTLTLNAAGAVTQSSAITGNTTVVKNGAGTFTLSQSNTYTGATNINAGTLALGAANRIADTSAVTVASGATFNLANFAETVGSLAGAGNVTLGSATLTAGGDNTSTTFSGVASGTGGLTKAGTGALTLSGANTYSGNTAVGAGTLVAANAAALGAAGGTDTVANGAVLNINNVSITGENVSIAGTGIGATGALTGSGTAAWGGSVTMTAASTVGAAAATDTLALNGVVGGAFALTKAGAGTLTLSGANTYTGATNINGGTLALGAAERIVNTSAVTVGAGATFNLAGFAETVGSIAGAGNITLGAGTLTAGGNNTNTTFNGVISGTGNLAKAGTGTLTLSGANTYTGTTTVNTGTLQVGAGGAAGTLGTGAVIDNAALVFSRSDALTVANAISGTGTVTKAGTGTTTLTGTNTYSGATTISTGTLQVGAGGIVGTLGTGAVTDNAALVFNRSDALTVGNVIGGTGTVTQVGAGTLTLSGANTYTGATNINAGTLVAASNGALGTAAGGAVVAAGATLALQGGITIGDALTLNGAGVGGGGALRNLGGNNTASGVVTLGAGGARINSDAGLLTLSGPIGGATQPLAVGGAGNTTITGVIGTTTGTLTKDGTGTLTLSGGDTYTGATNINAGTLALGAANRIANTSAVTVGLGATFNLAGFAETVGSITGAGNITLGAGTLTAGGDNTSTTFSGVISGTGGLAKAGTGVLTLSGANTYSGNTAVSAGTLVAANTAALGTAGGTNTVTSGATLNINNVSITGENVSIAGTGVGAAGALTGSGTAAWGGSVTMTANSTVGVAAANDTLALNGVVGGAFALTKAGAGTLTLSGANTYTGATNINGGTLVAASNGALGTAAGGAVVAAGATLALQGGITIGDALTLNGAGVGGGGALRNLGGNNTASGVVTLGAGGARINSDAGLLTLSGPIGGATQPLAVGGAGNTTITGVIGTTTGTLTKDGTGTLTLSGTNTYTGTTSINAGTLAVTSNNALGTNAAGTTVASGATLDFRNVAYATTEAVTLNGGTLAASTGTSSFVGPVTLGANSNVDVGGTQLMLSGVIGGAGFGISKQGIGTLVLSGTNTYTGATNINAGVLMASGGSAIPDASQVNLADVAGATLSLANSETIGNLAGGGAAGGNVVLGSNTLTVNQGAATTYSGVISGSGGLTKTGTDTLTLAGAGTYTGVTNINAGALAAANAAALGATAGGTNVGTSARLIVDSVALGTESITLNGPGLFGSGAITSYGAASIAGSVTLAGNAIIAPNSGSTLTLSGPVDGAFGLTTGGFGTLALNGAAGGTTPLAFLTTGNNGATAIASSVRTTGNQTYNNPTIFNAGTALVSTAGNISLLGVVTAPGAVSLQAAGDLLFQNSGNFGTLTATAGGTVIVGPAGQLAASGTGNAIVLSGSRFVNSAGPGALTATNGRWLVWSGNPNPFGGATPDNRGGLAYDFKQYNATYGVTPVAQPTGNGFLYSYAPTITPGLTGTVTKVYDATTSASLVGANFTPTSGVDGDVVAMSGTGSYDNANVAGSPTKLVTANGIAATAISSVADGSKSVYGYTLTSTTASANIGEITPAPLTVASIAGVNTTYGTSAATGAVSLSGVIGSDVVTSMASLVSPNLSTSGNLSAGSYAQSASSLGGVGAGNYTLTAYTTPTANYVVNRLALTGSISASDRVYDSTTAASITSRNLSGVIVGDSVSYIGGIANFANKNVGTAKTVTASGLGLSGTDAANYTVNSSAITTASITPAPLVLNAVSDAKVYDGTTGSSGVVGAVGLQGSDSMGNVSQSYASKNVLGTNASMLAVNGGYSVNDGNAGANYMVTTTTAQGTITPAPLLIAADDASKSFGAPNPPFSATYTGFVGGETPSVLSGVLSFQTVAGTTSPSGNYAITPYGQTSGNYAIVFKDGVLTINGVPTGLGDAGVTGADQQAIGAQYTSQGTPSLALAKIQYILAEGECVDETATSHGACPDQSPGLSVVRLINGGVSMPRQ